MLTWSFSHELQEQLASDLYHASSTPASELLCLDIGGESCVLLQKVVESETWKCDHPYYTQQASFRERNELTPGQTDNRESCELEFVVLCPSERLDHHFFRA